MRYLEVAGWKRNSCDDGPGIRSVLFLQGCKMNCEGCHNKDIQKRGEGCLLSVDEIVSFIVEKCHNKRLTISGGEPLEQWEALEVLLGALKGRKFDVCLYTGWKMEQIPKQAFQLVNYLKTGNFVMEKRNENLHYVGSSNQQMYHLGKDGKWEILDLGISA